VRPCDGAAWHHVGIGKAAAIVVGASALADTGHGVRPRGQELIGGAHAVSFANPMALFPERLIGIGVPVENINVLHVHYKVRRYDEYSLT
jgi:hypothetical protein